MKELKAVLEGAASACRVCCVDPDLGRVGEPCERAEGHPLGKVFLKSPEVYWCGPAGDSKAPRSLCEGMQAFYLGVHGGLRWALQLCDVSKGGYGQSVVDPGVKL